MFDIVSFFKKRLRRIQFTGILLNAVLFFSHSTLAQTGESEKPYLVVLSMDGFRWDYPDSVSTPNLDQIAKTGVKAKSIIPSFPSVTFPNHYTLATGLYPDHHGIVQNQFYDPTLQLTFHYNKKGISDDDRFYGGEPIWVTAEKQNVKSANFYWVGSEISIENIRPSYWKNYDPKISFEARIDTVMHWLSLSIEKRPHLIMFYFDEPDHAGHATGPFSSTTNHKVEYLDSLVGTFLKKVSQLPIADKINFIVTTDHGMESINDSKKIVIDKIIPNDWILRINGHNPMFMIDAKSGFADSIVARFENIPHINIWKKHEIPSRLHFGTNPKISELVLLADSGYSIGSSQYVEKGGTHGYDPANTDMHGIFYAMGPAFKKGYTRSSFENIHVYALMAKILGIVPAKNDGDIDQVKDLLINNH